MSVQTAYPDTPVVGYPGMIAQQFSQRQIDSYLAVSPVADLVAGEATERGAVDGEIKQLAALANWNGIAVAQYADQENSAGIIYEAGVSVPVMIRGRIYVLASAAVAIDAEVIPGTGATSGKFATGVATGLVKAYARTVAAADGDLMVVELVGPQTPTA